MINKQTFILFLKISLIIFLTLDILYKVVLIKLNVQLLLNTEEVILETIFIFCLIKFKNNRTFDNISYLLILNIVFGYIYCINMAAFDNYYNTLDYNFLHRDAFCFLELFISNTFCSFNPNDLAVIKNIEKENVPVLYGIIEDCLRNQKDFSVAEISEGDLFELLFPQVNTVSEILSKTDYYSSFGLSSEEVIDILTEQDYDTECKEIDAILKKMGSSLLLGGAVSGCYDQLVNYNEAWKT